MITMDQSLYGQGTWIMNDYEEVTLASADSSEEELPDEQVSVLGTAWALSPEDLELVPQADAISQE